MKHFLPTISLAFLLLFPILNYAVTCETIMEGDWNNASTWSCGVVPNIGSWPGDNVIIKHSIKADIDLTFAQQSSLVIKNGGSLSIEGDFSIISSNSSDFEIESGASFTVENFNFNSNNATFSSLGSLTVDNLTSRQGKFSTNGGQLTINSDLEVGGGNFILTNTTTIIGDDFDRTGGIFESSGGSIKVSGDWNISGGTKAKTTNTQINVEGDFKRISGLLEMGGGFLKVGSDLTLSGGSSATFTDMPIKVEGSFKREAGKLSLNNGSLNVTNDFDLEGGSAFELNGATASIAGVLTLTNGSIRQGNRSNLKAEEINLASGTSIVGVGSGGMLSFGSITNNGQVRCVSNACLYAPWTTPSIPSNSLDLGTGLLPVELAYFNAKQQIDHIQLEWVTESEENNDYFTIEYAKDGKNWQELSILSGNGTTHKRQYYTFEDHNKYSGTQIYYRLKQTDYDGSYSYSELVVLPLLGTQATDIVVAPNPVRSTFQVLTSFDTPIVAMELYNAIGQSWNLSFSRGGKNYEITLPSSINKGFYVLRIIQDGLQSQQQIIVH